MMLFGFLDQILHSLSWHESIVCKIFLLVAFAIPVFSGLRLAKFNIDERQKSSFLGLPVPAHAILWSSLIVVLVNDVHASICFFPQIAVLLASIPPVVLLCGVSITVVVTSLLLVSELPMFSLKITSFSWKANKLPFLLITSGIVFILLFGITGVAATILFYILLCGLKIKI
jgi:CDP-diacylglycerol--serine O-phosphatidyltransferase